MSAPPVGPSQLLRCNWIPLPLSSRLPALFEVISSAGKESGREGQRVTARVRGEVCVCVCVCVLVHAFKFVSLFVHAIHRRLQFKTLAPFLCSFHPLRSLTLNLETSWNTLGSARHIVIWSK